MFNAKTRKWIYLTLVAAFPVVCFYLPDLVPASPMWLALIAAVLNIKPDDVQAEPVFAREPDEQEPDIDDDV